MILHILGPNKPVPEDLVSMGMKYCIIELDPNTYARDLNQAQEQGMEIVIIKENSNDKS
jgi:hypothetical protein